MQGCLFDGKSPEAHKATLVIMGEKTILRGQEAERVYKRETLQVSPRTGNADRFIYFSDGIQFQCKDQEILDHLPQEFFSEGIVAWLENHVSVSIASILAVFCFLLIGYFYGIPALAERVAVKIPLETERTLGDHIHQWLDDNKILTTSEISSELQETIREEFSRTHKNLQLYPYMQLHFRKSELLGPNAIALPGGHIVITDQLIELAQSNNEIVAILAHEAGHVENRHSMRNILQSSIVTLAVASITADVSSMGMTMTGLPVLFLQSNYSREFEEAADDFAIHLLSQNNIPSTFLADILERIDAKYGEGRGNDFAFLSTHPITADRIDKMRRN